MSQHLLLDRDDELAAIADVLARARLGSGGGIVIEGPAGIGKTSLLAHGATAAAAAGMLVLEASGSELELEEPLGAVRELLLPEIEQPSTETNDLTPGAEAALSALGVLSLSNPGVTSLTPGERLALVIQGLHDVCRMLASRRALAVAVDDLQWVDGPSVRWLNYLARRLSRMPVALLVARRTDAVSTNGASRDGPALDQHLRRLRPALLSGDAVTRLIANATTDCPAQSFLSECHRLTGGNPFLVHSLLEQAVEEGISPTEMGAERLRALTPAAVRDALLLRIGRLPRAARQLAQAVAVLGDQAAAHDAAGVAEVPIQDALDAAAILVEAGVFRDDRALGFVHPLVSAAVHDELPLITRAALHGRAARRLHARGESSERVASHLLLSEPTGEPFEPETLAAAAHLALERGVPASAARYLRRALRDAPRELRPGLLDALGNALAATLAPDADATLSEAYSEAPGSLERSRIALSRSRLELLRGRPIDAYRHIEVALTDASELPLDTPGPRRLLFAAEAWRGGLAVLDATIAKAFERHLPRLRKLARSDVGAEIRPVQVMLGWREAYTAGDPKLGLELVERGVDNGAMIKEQPADPVAQSWAARALIVFEQLDRANWLAQTMLDSAEAGGLVGTYAAGCMWTASVALRRGDLIAAERSSRAALVRACEHELDFVRLFSAGFLAEALHRQGRSRLALETLDQLPASPMQGTSAEAILLDTRARVLLACGRKADAIAELERAGGILTGCGFRNPNTVAWRSALAAALPPEQADRARSLVASELADAQTAGSRRAEAIAVRAAGLLAASAREGAEQVRESLSLLEGVEAALERAESQIALGALLRRVGHRVEARRALAQGRDLAERSGAAGLAQRAHEELVAAGARPRRARLSGPDALTPRERAVSELAAHGLSNRELAERLFVTEKTVIAHLSRAYAKLGISSRRELPLALDGGDRLG